jgi:predicted nucleotide-binding protein
MRQGIDRLTRRIGELEAFDPKVVQKRWAPEVKAIETAISETLARVFGEDTPAYHRYSQATVLDPAPLIMGGAPDPIEEVHRWLDEGKTRALLLLKQAVRGLEEDLAEAAPVASMPTVAPAANPHSEEIFVVHGRDDKAKEQVARFIERAGLKAVILHEQPNGGKTIIEKFEKHGGGAGFAVVIATPDDVGGLVGEAQRPRARQNVIGEMFWFAGRLGRDRVCVLVKGEVDMPSDIAGVGYTPMDDHGGWKTKLLSELEEAGYENLDWRKASS